MKLPPEAAYGRLPLRGRHQRPGEAGSAVAPALAARFHASRVACSAMEN
jgi:hypothetical protein